MTVPTLAQAIGPRSEGAIYENADGQPFAVGSVWTTSDRLLKAGAK